MFDTRRQTDCAASWAYYSRQQELALAGKISIREITTAVVGDNCSFVVRDGVQHSTVSEALSELPLPAPPDECIDFLGGCFFAHRLIPVADPLAEGATWPTIVVPSEDDLAFFCDTEEDDERVLETLRAWRARVDEFASTTPCSPFGWIGGIWVPHPDNPEEMSMRWPWLHRPYGPEGRSGDPRLFELFKISVDRR
ncbi:hypothetical protein ACQR2B_29170 [Bradyrhizobium oligotrophicum]|uniref:hypothetical protein n=1 Tax=Bradyrhizobium TaxID=374 RepID=UPI003EBD371B